MTLDSPLKGTLIEEALRIGVRLTPYSHWPAAWHCIVIRVLRDARKAGVREVYIKEKFGGLRIQGGGASLLNSVKRAEKDSVKTCVFCGNRCNESPPPNLPCCRECGSSQIRVALRWIELPMPVAPAD